MIQFYNLKHDAYDRPPHVRILADAPGYGHAAASLVIWVSDSPFYTFDQYFLRFGDHKMTPWVPGVKSQLSPERQADPQQVFMHYGVYRKLRTQTSAPQSADNAGTYVLASFAFGGAKQMAAKVLGLTKQQYFVMLGLDRRPSGVMYSLFPGDEKCELIGEFKQDPITLADVKKKLRERTGLILRMSGLNVLN